MHQPDRLHALDAVRAFALLLGVFFHAALSFIMAYAPKGTDGVIADNSQSLVLLAFVGVTHLFRMSLFFFVAGFFAHLVYHRKGAQPFAVDRAKRIVLPLVVGWLVMQPLLGIIWNWSHQQAGLPLSDHNATDWSKGQVHLAHLWFLYYLILIYVVVVGTRHVLADRIDANKSWRKSIDSKLYALVDRRWVPILMSLPLAIAAIFAPEWNAVGGMPTPDHSIVPELIPLVGYGVAFTVGWLFHRNLALLPLLSSKHKSSWWLALLFLILTGSSAYVLATRPDVLPAAMRFTTALTATAMTWYFNLALIGYALKKFSNPSPSIRYVADASYWVYIAHLPLVFGLQIWVAHWNLHWSIKYPFIMSVAFTILFVSYHYLVRFTFIGAVLNGRKYSRTPNAVSVEAVQPSISE